MRELRRWERAIIVSGSVIGFLVLTTISSGAVFVVYRIPTVSMEPTLPVNCRVVVRRTRNVERGDLAAFHLPNQAEVKLVKRIVAVGGDTVSMRDKQLFVNGRAVPEPYVLHEDPEVYGDLPEDELYRSRDQLAPITVTAGTLFVLGDNRDNSNDSRYIGLVPLDHVFGKAIAVLSIRDGVRGL